MNNSFRGTASLKTTNEAGQDVIHILNYDANALVSFEEQTGITMGGIVDTFSDQSKISMKFIRAMLWAGLLKTNRNITLPEAGDILSDAGMEDAMKAVQVAFGGATKPRKTKADAPGN